MNYTRPYLNRFVKRKQLQIEDNYHSTNLKQMKPITSKLMEHSQIRSINNRKTEMIKEMKQIEIQRQNKLLLQKLASVASNYGAYSVMRTKSSRTKASKSLNDIYRKKQMENIECQNKRFLMRLQNKRATLDVTKLNRDWTDNKKIIKRMANCEFNLINLRSTSRGRQHSTNQNFYKDKWVRMWNINGHNMRVKIQFIDGVLKIIGDFQDHKDLKIIEIPKDQAKIFIEKDCHGQIQQIFEKLKYDPSSETMYLISENIEEMDVDFTSFNPEMNKIQQSQKHRHRGYYKEGRKEIISKESNKLETQKKEKQPNNMDILIIPAVKPKTAQITANQLQNSHQSISKSLLSVQHAIDTKDPLEKVVLAQDQQNPMNQYNVQIEVEQGDYNEINLQESLPKNEESHQAEQQQLFIQKTLQQNKQQKTKVIIEPQANQNCS